MADSEEKAIFVGLRNDAQEALPNAAKPAGSFGDETADRMETSLGKHAENEAKQAENITALGKRPAEEPQGARMPKAPKTNAAADAGDIPEGDVTDAGVTSSGASNAESGATDPVDVVSGQLLDTVIDFSLPGVLPLVLRRAYTSGYQHGALLGPGWSSTLDIRLLVDESSAVTFLGDDAQRLDYGVPFGFALGLPSYPAHGARWPLAHDAADEAWTVTNPLTGLVYRFASEGSVRPISAIRDRAGNEIRLVRDEAGRLVSVEHSGGYRIIVALVESGGGTRIASYALAKTGEQQDDARLVGFEYDEAGRLVRVLDSTDAAHCYEWDEHDRICAWIDKAGYRYPYRYDAEGRVVETGEEGGFKHARLEYEPAARTTSVTDALGNTTVYSYDRFQQITSITDPCGAVTTVRKDAYGRLLEHTTPLGHTTRFDYDHDGNRTAITYPDGEAARMAYHAPGLVARIDLPDGARWRYEYDERGNPAAEIDPLGAVTRFTYDQHGAVLAITDPLGAVWRYEVNAAGLPVAAIDPVGSRTEIERNQQGRITRMREADGALTLIERDTEGRVVAQTAPDGAVTRYNYDISGNQSQITDPSGRVIQIDYGPFYRPIARTHPDGSRYSFGYDAELRLTTVTGPTGLTWNYTYDNAGRRIAEHDFDGREQRYRFDDDGRLIEHAAPDGVVTAYTRDAAGRLVELRAGTEASSFGYDRVGRLVQAINRHANVSITRDLLGRTVREEINGTAVTRAYDAAGNLIERTTGSGAISRWTYDTLGEAASLSTGEETLTFQRDVLGREIRRELGAFTLTQDYDAAGQLASQRMTAGGRVLQERTYGYDPDGLPVRINDLLRGTRVMNLDPVGRVTSVHHGDSAEQYAYDAIGNLTASRIPDVPAESEAAAALGAHTLTATRTTRAGRTEFAYDERGQLIGKTRRTLSGQKLTWSYTWNAHDRLTAVTRPDGQQWAYRYDALGRRIDKTRIDDCGRTVQTVMFSWDGTLLAEQTTQRPDAPAVTVTWDYEPGSHRPAAQRRSEHPPTSDGPLGDDSAPRHGHSPHDQDRIDAEFWAIVTDLTGRPQELVDHDGRIAWVEQTPLWGARPDLGTDAAGASGDGGCPIGFPGQYYDQETGLYYNNQRYYDPDTAAYLSPDPVGLEAAPNPNRYVENPLAQVDPLGLTPQSPTPRMKTDDELQADADALHETIRTKYGNRAYNGSTVSAFQGEDGRLFYSVNGSKTNNIMRDLADRMGYQRISGAEVTGNEQTDAEQLMLNGVDKGRVPDAGRIATSRPPCGEFRNNGKPAQNCAARIAGYAKIRLVGRYAP